MGVFGFSGNVGRKMENWLKGRPAVGGLIGERPAVMFWWWVRWWVVVGVGGFGFGEEKDGGAGMGGCTAGGENGGKKGNVT
jgi:hypothetical protein